MEQSYEIIENLLSKFKHIIAVDYNRYKNHICRVYSNCLALDNEKNNEEKYAIAAVFHDIGIWTNQTIDYLDPSIAQAKNYLIESGKQEWIDEITQMIHWHHKTSSYRGDYEKTVETFRQADWIDVSLGMLAFGIPSKEIRRMKKQFPNLGFHWLLVKKLAKNLVKHPGNPLPMFTK